MKRLKRLYFYMFYQLYRWYEKGPSVWLSEWKASLTLIILELWLVSSFLIYYKIFFNPNADIVGSQSTWVALVILIVLIDYFIFHHRYQWKEIVKEFDQLPKRINKIASWISWGLVSFIIINLIFSFYLYYQT